MLEHIVEWIISWIIIVAAIVVLRPIGRIFLLGLDTKLKNDQKERERLREERRDYARKMMRAVVKPGEGISARELAKRLSTELECSLSEAEQIVRCNPHVLDRKPIDLSEIGIEDYTPQDIHEYTYSR